MGQVIRARDESTNQFKVKERRQNAAGNCEYDIADIGFAVMQARCFRGAPWLAGLASSLRL
jgi:hypothetical protein